MVISTFGMSWAQKKRRFRSLVSLNEPSGYTRMFERKNMFTLVGCLFFWCVKICAHVGPPPRATPPTTAPVYLHDVDVLNSRLDVSCLCFVKFLTNDYTTFLLLSCLLLFLCAEPVLTWINWQSFPFYELRIIMVISASSKASHLFAFISLARSLGRKKYLTAGVRW